MATVSRRTPLRAALEERDWSYTRLIAEMRGVAARDGKALPKTESLMSMISRWVNGHERPDKFNQNLLSKALAMSAAELGFEDLPELLAGASAYTQPWELIEALERTSIGKTALVELGRTAVRYIQAYPFTPPRAIYDPVVDHLCRVIDKLKQPQPSAQRRQLTVIAAQLATTAGSLSFDLNNPDQAHAYFRAALMAGNEAADDDLRAWVLAMNSLLPTSRGDHKAALELLDGAFIFAAYSPAPTRLAWVAGLKARAHAGVGDLQDCREALGVADNAMSHGDEMDSRPDTDFFDRPRLEGLRGACLSRIGQAKKAKQILHRVLAERDASCVKGRALVKADLASAYVQDSQPQDACALTVEALSVPTEFRVDPIIRRACDVRVELEPWSTTQAVRELDEFLGSLGITFRTP